MATRMMKDDEGVVPCWTPPKETVVKKRHARGNLSVSLDFQQAQAAVVSARADAQAPSGEETDNITPTSSALQDRVHAANADFAEAAVTAEKIQRLATTASPEQVAALITRLLALRTAEKKAQTLEQNNQALLQEVQRLRGIVAAHPASPNAAGVVAVPAAPADGSVSSEGAAVLARARAQQAEAAALASRVSSALAQGVQPMQPRARPTAAPAAPVRAQHQHQRVRARQVAAPMMVVAAPAVAPAEPHLPTPVLAPGVVNYPMFSLKRTRVQREEADAADAAEVPEEPEAKRASP